MRRLPLHSNYRRPRPRHCVSHRSFQSTNSSYHNSFWTQLISHHHHSPLKVAEQGAHQLPYTALTGGDHTLQTHHQVLVVLGVQHNQLVLPRGHTQSRHLRLKPGEKRKERHITYSSKEYVQTYCTVDNHKCTIHTNTQLHMHAQGGGGDPCPKGHGSLRLLQQDPQHHPSHLNKVKGIYWRNVEYLADPHSKAKGNSDSTGTDCVCIISQIYTSNRRTGMDPIQHKDTANA